MRKVIMIGPDSQEKGGIATVIANFKVQFKDQDLSMTYLVSWKSGSLIKRLLIFLRCFLQLGCLLKKDRQQLVHIHVAQDGSYFRKQLLSRLASVFHAKVVLHMHASQFDLFYQKANPKKQRQITKLFDKVYRLVVLSEEWAGFYQTLTTTEILIIENAVNCPPTNLYQGTGNKIVTFGRIGQRKGSYDILEVAALVKNSLPDVEFWLYGDGEIQKVQQLIDERDLKNVKLGGWLRKNQLPAIYQESLLHLLPSYHEGLPMSVLETMAQGIPNISSDVGGLPQVITHQENGYLVKAGDSQEIAQLITSLVSDQDRRRRLSQQAYETIHQSFGISDYCQKWRTLYHQSTD